MPSDNVVPIDADSARVLARRVVRFRWFVAASVLAWLAILVPVVTFTPLPPLAPFVVLALLLVLSEHRFVLFGDETSMSGSIIIAIASVFVFADSAPFAGPMIVASLGGLYLPHLRHRQFMLVLANCSTLSVAAACACLIAYGMNAQETGELMARTSAVVPTVGAYWLANSALIGLASSARNGAGVVRAVSEQLTSDCSVLLLAVAAALVGVICSDGSAPELVALLMVPLAAFEVRLRVRRRPRCTNDSRPGNRRVAMLCATSATLLATMTTTSISLGLVAVFLAVTLHQPSRSALVSVVVATTGGATLAFALHGAHVSGVGQAIGAAFVTYALLSFVELGSRVMRSAARISPCVLLGSAIPGIRDIPTIACAAFLSALVSYGANATRLFIACGLLIAATSVSSSDSSSRHSVRDRGSVGVP